MEKKKSNTQKKSDDNQLSPMPIIKKSSKDIAKEPKAKKMVKKASSTSGSGAPTINDEPPIRVTRGQQEMAKNLENMDQQMEDLENSFQW